MILPGDENEPMVRMRKYATKVALRQVVEADCPGDRRPNHRDRPMQAKLDGNGFRSEGSQNPNGGAERRRSPRHRLRNAPGTLNWHEGDAPVTCAMTMVDISGGGAAVLAERAPLVNQALWIRLDSGDGRRERLEARVVSTSAETSGKFIVRMQFTSWIELGNVLEQHGERRLWQRHPARETHASLAWLEKDVEQHASGELMNISGGGAAVITDAMLPEEQPVWLTLAEGPDAIAPVEAHLVVVSIDASGLRIARLRFVEACPMDLFELAVHGR